MHDEINLGPAQVRDLAPEVQLLDVRQPWEFAIAKLPGAILIPLGELGARLAELDPNRPIVAYCHHGARSMHAIRFLAQAGFPKVAHLAGGLAAYSRFDPTIPQY